MLQWERNSNSYPEYTETSPVQGVTEKYWTLGILHGQKNLWMGAVYKAICFVFFATKNLGVFILFFDNLYEK